MSRSLFVWMRLDLEEDTHLDTDTILKNIQLEITFTQILVASVVFLIIVGNQSSPANAVQEIVREVNTCENSHRLHQFVLCTSTDTQRSMEGVVFTISSSIIRIIKIAQSESIHHLNAMRVAKSTTHLGISTKRKIAKFRGDHLQHQRDFIDSGFELSIDSTQLVVGNRVCGTDVAHVIKAIVAFYKVNIDACDNGIILSKIVLSGEAKIETCLSALIDGSTRFGTGPIESRAKFKAKGEAFVLC